MSDEIVYCPSCNHQLRVPDDLLGQAVECPQCGTNFTAPVPGSAPAARPASHVRSRPSDESRPSPGRQANLLVPAILLLATGLLGLFGSGRSVYIAFNNREEAIREFDDRIKEAMKNQPQQQQQQPPIDGKTIIDLMGILGIVGLCLSVFNVGGSVAMMTRSMYPLAVIGAISAIVNFMTPLCCLPGLLAGIWCLVVLTGDAGKAAFRSAPPNPELM